jgi:hypothetical protein
MKTIKLTQGLVTMVDDEEYEELNKHKWCALRRGNTFYALRAECSNGKHKAILMHREIIQNHSKLPTDHIDGDGLNNCKENLRIVTTRQNAQNKHTSKSSKYAGVCWHKARGKWQTQIRINGIRKYLGLFGNEIEAHQAYVKALKDIDEILINDCRR